MNTHTHALNPSAASPLWRSLTLEAWLEFLKTLRTPDFALPALIFPVAFYTLFGLVFGGRGFSAAEWYLATIGSFGIIGPALFGFGASIASEREQGWLRLRAVTPAPPLGYFLAKLAMAMLFALLIGLLLALLASVFGGVRLEAWRWLALFSVYFFGCLPFAALGLTIGLLVSAQAAPTVVQLIYMPLGALAGLWWPLFFMPATMQAIAWLLPTFHLGQLALTAVGAVDAPVLVHAAALAAYGALFLWLAVRLGHRLGMAP